MRKWIAISLAAGIVAAAELWFGPFGTGFMSPRYSGFTRDGRHRYELTARSAVADSVALVEPRTSLEMTGGRKLTIRAATGVFDTRTGALTMRGDAVLVSGAGHVAHMSEAVIDVRNNTVVSESPVEIKLEQRTLRGDRLEVRGSGYLLIFNGSITDSNHVVSFGSYALE